MARHLGDFSFAMPGLTRVLRDLRAAGIRGIPLCGVSAVGVITPEETLILTDGGRVRHIHTAGRRGAPMQQDEAPDRRN